ncbi:hypothetical protein [Iningainema tapete]|nr:hypothetical protein [Iningainema tapete]
MPASSVSTVSQGSVNEVMLVQRMSGRVSTLVSPDSHSLPLTEG